MTQKSASDKWGNETLNEGMKGADYPISTPKSTTCDKRGAENGTKAHETGVGRNQSFQKKTVILTENELADAIHEYLLRNGRVPEGLNTGTMQFNIERKGRLGIGNTRVIYTEDQQP